MTDAVFEMVKNALHITYELDKSSEERISRVILDGIRFFKTYCDPETDCSPGSDCGRLLCEYARYAESGALERFSRDYAGDITAIKLKSEVARYAEAMGYVED